MLAHGRPRTTQQRGTTQKLLRLGDDPKSYLEEFERLDATRAGGCPFCQDGHRLRAHGSYERWVLVLVGESACEELVRVKRFLCTRVGRTVSLLPDFCLPRRRSGTDVVGRLLGTVTAVGGSLRDTFARMRRELEGPRSAQALVAGFLARRPQLEAYGARLQRRAPDLPLGLGAYYQEVARLWFPLRQGRVSDADALRHHGLRFHAQFGVGIA